MRFGACVQELEKGMKEAQRAEKAAAREARVAREAIKQANGLSGDTIVQGRTLQIPR